MRILFVCNEYPPSAHGGIGSFVYTLAHQLMAHGNEIHVVGFDQGISQTTKKSEQGVTVLRLVSPFYGRWYLRWRQYDVAIQVFERMYLSRQVKVYCEQHNINLVESYDWSGPLWFPLGRPLLVRMHGAHSAHALYEGKRSSRFLLYVEKRNLRMAHALVGVSQHIGEWTLKLAGLWDRAFDVVYNGVDMSVFRPLDTVKRSENEVLFAGTVARRKGIYELFDAIPLVLAAVPAARFTILGRLPVDEKSHKVLVDELLAKIPPTQQHAVVFTDARPYSEMPHWYSRAACAVFPSLAEAYGLTCAEAMACGTPVVMTSRASGPEIVEDNVSGFLREPTDRQALAEAIIALLKDPELRKKIPLQAIERVREKFEIGKKLQNNITIYQRLIDHEQE